MYYKVRGVSAKSGKGTVYVVYRQNGANSFETAKTTGVTVKRSDFDTKTGRVKSRVIEHPELNAKIQAVANDIETAVRNVEAFGQPMTKQALEAQIQWVDDLNKSLNTSFNEFEGEFSHSLSKMELEIKQLEEELEKRKQLLKFLKDNSHGFGQSGQAVADLFTDKISAYLTANPKHYGEATAKGYKDLASMITKFRPHLQLQGVNLEFLSSFQQHLVANGLRNQSIRTILTRLKTVYKYFAEDEGLPIGFLSKFTMVSELANDNVIFLTQSEIDAVAALELKSNTQRQVQQQFLFSCEVGLRHSDLCITPANITGDTLTVTMKKSKRTVKPPLTQRAKEILSGPEFPFRKIHANHYNKALQSICKKAVGFDALVTVTHFVGNEAQPITKEKWQLMSSHVGRKTAINRWLQSGVRETVAALWAGHKDTKMIEKYYQNKDAVSAQEAEKLRK